jgi:hypothetical protein
MCVLVHVLFLGKFHTIDELICTKVKVLLSQTEKVVYPLNEDFSIGFTNFQNK